MAPILILHMSPIINIIVEVEDGYFCLKIIKNCFIVILGFAKLNKI